MARTKDSISIRTKEGLTTEALAKKGLPSETDVKSGYKKTKLGWIPEDWEVDTLGELCQLQSGYAFKSENFGQGNRKLITPQNFTKYGAPYFSLENTKVTNEEVDKKYICTEGDLLVLLTDLTSTCELLGKPALLSKDDRSLLLNQRIVKLTTNSRVDKRYLTYYFLTEKQHQWIKNTATGTTVRHSSNKSLSKSVIPLPPLPEQQKIARILSAWDKAITKTGQLIAKKQQCKKGLMQLLLTGKKRFSAFVTPVGVTSPDGKEFVKNEWKKMEIQEIGTVIRGASPRPKGDPRYYGGDMPRLMVQDVTRDGKYVTPTIDFLTTEGAKLSRPCKSGTLTIVCSGEVGTPSFLAVDACIHDGFLAITDTHTNIDNDYLYYQMYRLKSRIERSATHGGVFTNLTTTILKQFVVEIHKIEEQKKIASVLSAADQEIDKLQKQLEQLKEQKKGLMQKLLTGQIRVHPVKYP